MQHLRGGADAFSSQSRVVFYVNEDSLGACEVAVQVMLFSVRVCAGADRRLWYILSTTKQGPDLRSSAAAHTAREYIICVHSLWVDVGFDSILPARTASPLKRLTLGVSARSPRTPQFFTATEILAKIQPSWRKLIGAPWAWKNSHLSALWKYESDCINILKAI